MSKLGPLRPIISEILDTPLTDALHFTPHRHVHYNTKSTSVFDSPVQVQFETHVIGVSSMGPCQARQEYEFPYSHHHPMYCSSSWFIMLVGHCFSIKNGIFCFNTIYNLNLRKKIPYFWNDEFSISKTQILFEMGFNKKVSFYKTQILLSDCTC